MIDSVFSRIECLDGTALKIIALIAMTIDHIGMILFPNAIWMRVIGRLAFPIFAYMVAEGCYYTKNRKKYLAMMFAIGIPWQIVMFIIRKSLHLNIMFTLGMGIALIFLLQNAFGRRSIIFTGSENSDKKVNVRGSRVFWWIAFAVALAACIFLCEGLPDYIRGWHVDYGIFGVLLPLVIYVPGTHFQKLFVAAFWVVFLGMNTSGMQFWMLLAPIPLALYNGKPGKHRMKYFFYLYYPGHLAVLWWIYFALRSRT